MSQSPAETAAQALPVIVLGAGGHALVLLDLLQCLGREVVCCIDDDPAKHGQSLADVPIQPPDEALRQHLPDTVRLVNAVGSVALPEMRRCMFERFAEQGYRFATLVHPTAAVARSATLGEGVQVMANATVQARATLGRNTLINSAATVDHEAVLGDHVHIAPGATLSGQVTIGHTSHVGAGATIVQGVRLGERVVVGAGAVVLHDVDLDTTVVGVPARPMRR